MELVIATVRTGSAEEHTPWLRQAAPSCIMPVRFLVEDGGDESMLRGPN